jgi:hypothetical protein
MSDCARVCICARSRTWITVCCDSAVEEESIVRDGVEVEAGTAGFGIEKSSVGEGCCGRWATEVDVVVAEEEEGCCCA